MRIFRGHQFHLEVPAEWVNRSNYCLKGPVWGHDQAVLLLLREPRCKARSAEAYAQNMAKDRLAALPGWEPLRRINLATDEEPDTILIEFHNAGPGNYRLYRRHYYRVLERTAYTFIVQLGRPSRKRMSKAIDQMVLGFVLRVDDDEEDENRGASCARGPTESYVANTFEMPLFPFWTDATSYALSAPGAAGAIHNIAIRREGWDETWQGMPFLEKQMEAEIEIMQRSIPGFEVVKHDRITLTGGRSVPHLICKRTAPTGLPLQQRLIMVARQQEVFTLCLTSEEDPDEDLIMTYDQIFASFDGTV